MITLTSYLACHWGHLMLKQFLVISISWLTRLPTKFLMAIISRYQLMLSSSKGYSCSCRVHLGEESCSSHAVRVLEKQPLSEALLLIWQRSRQCRSTSQKNGFSIKSSYFNYGLMITMLAFVTGCGGGGGDDSKSTTQTTSNTTNTNTTNPSDNQNKTYLTGTVAVGKAVSYATVFGTCTNGMKTSTIANSSGIYSANFSGVTPCTLETTLKDDSLLRSIAVKSGQANLNTFTEAQYVFANGKASNYSTSQQKLYSSLNDVGIHLNQDPVTTKFNTDGKGIDASLDQFKTQSIDNKSFAGSTASYNLAVNNFVTLSGNSGYTSDGSLSFWELFSKTTSNITETLRYIGYEGYDVADSLKTVFTSFSKTFANRFTNGSEKIKEGFDNWVNDLFATDNAYQDYFDAMSACFSSNDCDSASSIYMDKFINKWLRRRGELFTEGFVAQANLVSGVTVDVVINASTSLTQSINVGFAQWSYNKGKISLEEKDAITNYSLEYTQTMFETVKFIKDTIDFTKGTSNNANKIKSIMEKLDSTLKWMKTSLTNPKYYLSIQKIRRIELKRIWAINLDQLIEVIKYNDSLNAAEKDQLIQKISSYTDDIKNTWNSLDSSSPSTVSPAQVQGVDQSTLTRGVPVRVTVYGNNLPANVVFAIESVECSGDYARSSSGVVQTCTAQAGTPSNVRLVVKDAPGGNILPGGNYTISFSVVDAAAPAQVQGVDQSTLTRGVPVRVTVYGNNLPANVVFAIESVECSGDYARSSSGVVQTCTAQAGTPSNVRLVVKDAPGGNILPGGNYTISFSVR
jgi:putative component of membrane protein insertase Oxa1/YidC/SpoIIIJ protein YidD